MRDFRSVLAAILMGTALTPCIAADGDEALFGLRWGMNLVQLKAAGVELAKTKGEQNLETYKATKMPRPLSDGETYMLTFDEGKLVKMSALTRKILNDPSGIKGKERFEVLEASLKEKYGASTLNYQKIGLKLYKDSEEFYECLRYAGCGMWASAFETSDKSISIELQGLRRGEGYL